LHDRTRDSDDDDLHDRDYDVAALANNLSQAFRPDLFSNEGSGEVCFNYECYAVFFLKKNLFFSVKNIV